MKHVIIGNGPAAIGAAEAIREHNKKDPIILISDEKYHTYSRPLIPKILTNEKKAEDILYREEDFYKKNKIDAILGKKVVSVDHKQKKVLLKDKATIDYDNLLIATGGKPFIPPMKGIGKDVLGFTRIEDALRLKNSREKSIVVIGAGLIGLKAAESLAKTGKKVTVVELADRVLASITDDKASSIMETALKDSGINLILGTSVVEIKRKKGEVVGVILKDGRKISCDLVVAAVGVVPNLDVVKDTSIKFNRGIIVEHSMQTNVKNIYAAGDVVESYDILLDQKRTIPIWPLAYIQGSIAGLNMIGKQASYDGGYPMNIIEFFGVPIMSLGIIKEDEDSEVLEKYDPRKMVYKKIILKNDIIKGAILINMIDRAGIINGLIKEKTNVKNFKKKLLEEEIGFLILPEYIRKQKLYATEIES